ncbi:MAG: CRISPR-associated endonuclease Cas2 [Bacteroidales bacterium]|nr:CRISPR-associated endonuclease Cas2 [Bacteroidales bacterium]MBN2756754.1 CRISPR-associated endonuclease Cas2 [Bacteroidales bacterium]
MPELSERIKKILEISLKSKKHPEKMLFLVMYDIQDNKVRTQIAKYFITKGCTRIQK